jgi:8-oxo-dGTP pyrophosphatase MutT (NUDIX family)
MREGGVWLPMPVAATRPSVLCRLVPFSRQVGAPDFTMRATESRIICQCGALPFSVDANGKSRVLLVTTRGSRRWIIPKGWPIRNLTSAATAAREAYEEAGLIGSVVGEEPIGFYRYEKRRHARQWMICEVAVFLFAVERQLRKWPEKAERETRWFAPEEAAALVASPELAGIMLTALSEARLGAVVPTA